METSENKFEIIHETISKGNNVLSVKILCEIAGVSRSGYYNWVRSADKRSEKEARDRADFELILEAYHFRGYDKGTGNLHEAHAYESTHCYECQKNTAIDEKIRACM